MKQAFIGTCVENPNLLAAVSPVGNTIALSLLAISVTSSKAESNPLSQIEQGVWLHIPHQIDGM